VNTYILEICQECSVRLDLEGGDIGWIADYVTMLYQLQRLLSSNKVRGWLCTL